MLTPWWKEIAYLSMRTSVITSSPGIVLPTIAFSDTIQQAAIASKLIQSMLSYHHMIIENKIPQDVYGKTKLDMFQYKLLYGTTRIPRHSIDQLKLGSDMKVWSDHIVVIRNGNPFKVKVYDQTENVISLEQLEFLLKEFVYPHSQFINPFPILAGSGGDRETWAKIYAKMEQYNPELVESIEKALFVVNLDSKIDSNNPNSSPSYQSLSGGGKKSNSINRYFDKCIQVNVGFENQITLTNEHTVAELPPLALLCDIIMNNFETNAFKTDSNKLKEKSVEKLNFYLDESMKINLGIALKKVDELTDKVDATIHTFKGFGKSAIKKMQLSPDSFIQLALNLAFFKIHKNQPTTLEAVSLRKFKEGRTETIRLPTVETADFVKKVVCDNSSGTEVKNALIRGVVSHKSYTNECINGYGMDRHLLGLRLAARDLKINLPKIFLSPIYQKMIHFQLITSQVPTKHKIAFGFTPVHEDNYGVCYNPRQEEILFFITAPKYWKKTSSVKFVAALEESLTQMESILINSPSLIKAKM
uniref:Carn_acyltransf domain-containing protein n=1 Tax=Rhabditophanes sp. KR3021 TaxID=114890 RepID=A0AC35TXD6_9BILA